MNVYTRCFGLVQSRLRLLMKSASMGHSRMQHVSKSPSSKRRSWMVHSVQATLLTVATAGNVGLGVLPVAPAAAQLEMPSQVNPEVTGMQANRLLFEGAQFYYADDLEAAEARMLQALELYQQMGDRTLEATTLQCLRVVYDTQDNFPAALNAWQQATALDAAVNRCETELLLQEGYEGKLHLAYESWWYEDAESLRAVMPEDPNERQPRLFRLAFETGSTSYYQNQLRSLQASLAEADANDNTEQQMATLTRMGDVYLQLQDYETAINAYTSALANALESGDAEQTIHLYEKLGIVYLAQGEDQQALDLYENQLDHAIAANDLSGQSTALERIGSVYYLNQNYPQALEVFLQAAALVQDGGDLERNGRLLGKIGFALDAQNRTDAAIVFLKQSVHMRESVRRSIQQRSAELRQHYLDSVADTYRRLADLLLQRDRVLEAQHVMELMKVRTVGEYLHYVRGADNPGRVTVRRAEQSVLEEFSQFQQTALQLGQDLNQLRQEALARELTPEEDERLVQLSRLQQSLRADFNDFVARWNEERKAAENDPQEQAISMQRLDALRDKLRQLDAVLIYPLVLDDRLELLITTPDTPTLRRTVVGVGRTQLNRAVAEFRQALQDPTSDALIPAQQLYSWLVEPLEDDLAVADPTALIYSPDAALRYIPLGALHDGEQWLVERYPTNTITAVSLEELVTVTGSEPRILAGAFADETQSYTVDLGDRSLNFRGLPFAGTEVESLAANLPNVVSLMNREFNWEAITPDLFRYNIIHFATHAAFVPGDRSESFILAGDGKTLTVSEIETWDLNAIDLVVLSACETGLGGFDNNGEQVLGMGYVFQNQGARSILASLWQVNDESTQVLMNGFYEELMEDGNSKIVALQQAQQSLIQGQDRSSLETAARSVMVEPLESDDLSQGRGLGERGDRPFAHPYYWAPFILIGNGL